MTAPLPISTLEFNSGLPVWLALGLGVVAMISVLYFYLGQRSAAIRLLFGLRLVAVFTVVTVLIAPSRVWTFEHHSRGRLYLLLDDSRSMSRVDPPQTRSRAKCAEEALAQLRPTLDQFDVTVVPLSRPESLMPAADQWFETARQILHRCQGTATAIGSALEFVSNQSDSASTIVLISDGRQNKGQLPAPVVHLLASRGSRLFTLAAGSSQPVRDAAVETIDAPAFALAGDEVLLSAILRLDAVAEPVTVSLTRDGQLVDKKTVSAAPTTHTSFTDPAPSEGEHTYAISVDPLADEATTRNNQLATKVSVRKDKIRVLLVDDEPRWEYQFLKTRLQLDHTVDLTSLLLQPARIENIATPPIQPLPKSVQEWSAFNVVILGDVSPTALTPSVQTNLTEALRHGKPRSLFLIAGPRNLPSRYVAAPLGGLLPVDLTQTPSTETKNIQGFAPVFTAEAQNSTLVRLFPDDQINRSFWAAVPTFDWHDEHTAVKPGAQVIWQAAATSSAQQPIPLLASMTYGASRILYLAGPETWRLRYVQSPTGEVEDLHRRFWSQALRWSIAGESAVSDSTTRDPEDMNVSADPALMAAVAKAGNGASFDVSDAQKLAAALPTTDHAETLSRRIGLFENPNESSTRYLHWAVFVTFVIVLSAEWVIRKRRGLV
jgi:hypothetical protein